MGSSSFSPNDLGFFSDLARDWRKRLEDVEPFEAGIPAEGLDIEGASEVAQKIEDLQNSQYKNFGPAFNALAEAYLPYRDRVASELASRGFPNVQEGLQDFEAKTGLENIVGEVGPVSYDDALHELVSHQRPYDLGMAVDYRDFYAGVDPEGKPVVVRSNTVTPMNEDLASIIDADRNRVIRGKPPIAGGMPVKAAFLGGNVDLLSRDLNKQSRLDDASRRLLGARLQLQYPHGTRILTEEIGPSDTQTLQELDKAAEFLNKKYLEPMGQRHKGLVATQFPGVSTKITGLLDVDQFLNKIELATGERFDTSKLFYGIDPVSAAVRGVPEYLGALKRTPSALLPGAADLIPSPEAIQTGYAKGPVEMGKQMAAEFAQSLPSAAAASAVLSTPAIAPLAPGIGAGLVGTAGARALNEVVRQQTGEGIVPKIRQAIGTKPRSGKASRDYKPPSAEYRPAQITKATPQAVANLEKQRTQSELQRRMQLARERFNPAKGEFGLTEMLFGR
jgi:hypothetical protein